MRILALEPYYGGSHRAFVDGWASRSRHEWTMLTLPAHHWKWRMRHSAVTFADALANRRGERWDAIFCSDMLNLAELRGLAPSPLQDVPAVMYFHENQLTYPAAHPEPRDVHFAFIHVSSALAARAVWFNSAFHRDEFLAALAELLAKMPDYPLADAPGRIRDRSSVQCPGIEFPPARSAGPAGGPLHILWAARWEHDKNPEAFFDALERLGERGVDFRLSVIGEQFRDAPAVFERARRRFAERIDRWGYQHTRHQYAEALTAADVVVSTAVHEFFGLSVVEAIAAGAFPVLPRRLAYPELLGEAEGSADFFYDGSVDGLTERLTGLADRHRRGDLWGGDPGRARRPVRRFAWDLRAAAMDDAIAEAVR